MTDLVQTATSVVAGANAVKQSGILGETVTAGMPIVRDPTTRKFFKTDVDSATAYLRGCDGIALNGGAVNQPVTYQTEGDINVGATLAVGTTYLASDTAGGIRPAADSNSGDYNVILGIASTTTNLKLKINAAGAVVP